LWEAWSRPSELSALGADLVRRNAAIGACIDRAVAVWQQLWTGQELPDNAWLKAAAGDRLLRALLETAPIQDVAIERFLTGARAALLELAARSDCGSVIEDDILGFFCALTRQCFITEYVFAQSDDECRRVLQLQRLLEDRLASGGTAPALWLAA